MRQWVFTAGDALALAVTLGVLAGVAMLWLIVELGLFALRVPV